MSKPIRQTTRSDYEARMLRVLVHIQQNLDEALCLDDLATVACFSPFHFHRVFRGMLGESVKEHVRRLRLERAAHRLTYTDQPVTRIAFEAGYEAHESFTRAFSARFDDSPSAFRKTRRAATGQSVPQAVEFSSEALLRQGGDQSTRGSTMDVKIETLAARRVLFIRHTGPYDQVGQTWSRLYMWAGMRGILAFGPTPFGVAYDDPSVTPPERLRYDACLAVGENAQPADEVGAQTVDGGCYAVAQHLGAYDKLADTYAELCGVWLPGSGRELRSAPALEFYRNSPTDTPPDRLITDIYMPLED